MQQLVKNWINGKQEYYTGIALLKACGASVVLYQQLKQGITEGNKKLLKEFLVTYYEQSKNTNNTTTPLSQNKLLIQEQNFVATPLYLACKKEADNMYKEIMNKRAILFASVRNLLPHEDANTPDRIEARRKPSIEISMDFQQVSKLYDRADFVKQNGKLPFTNAEVIETMVDGIPDPLLKPTIDNLRKNINKLKKREQTPARIALVQSHEEKLNRLLSRWQLLKLEQ